MTTPTYTESKYKPKVALIGRPNVGKSSLFNRLTRSKKALVAERAGLTRDRRYAEISVDLHQFILIDTGGIGTDLSDPLAKNVVKQTLQAINEADVLIIIFDAEHGLTPDDMELLNLVRRSQKPFLAVVNKIDSSERTVAMADFYETGLDDLLDVSAKTGHGLGNLKENIAKALSSLVGHDKGTTHGFHEEAKKQAESFAHCEPVPIRVAIIGRPNVGKSSILNKIVGEERMVVSDIPGTTRDSIDSLVERNGFRPLVFIDTAGVRRKSRVKDKIEKFSIMKSLDSIKESDICLCVFDATEGITDQDKRLVGYTADMGKGCITVFNKWDLVKGDPKRRRMLNEEAKFFRKLMPYAPHINISALTGKNVDKIFPMIHQVYKDFTYKETTGKLNRLLRQALLKRNPPVTKGHYLKLYYVTQTGTRPPTFTFFANYPELFPTHYKRFLGNFFRQSLNISTTPVKIVLRAR